MATFGLSKNYRERKIEICKEGEFVCGFGGLC